MFCPQCGTESSQQLKYCRTCGANLKVIGKAVSLSAAIARSDGVPAKIKEMVQNLKIEKVTEEVSRAMDKMNREIVRSSNEPTGRKPWWLQGKTKTPEQRRERHLVSGTIRLFWGGGLTIFLYYLAHAMVLKLPPDVIARTPFEIDPVVRVLWLFGLIPMLSGLGHIIAGFTIRRGREKEVEFTEPTVRDEEKISLDEPAPLNLNPRSPTEAPASITERTTNILERKVSRRPTNDIGK